VQGGALVVVHGLTTSQKGHLIVVLDNGQLVEVGNFAILVLLREHFGKFLNPQKMESVHE
jgi:ABC-type multidrug transport system fused ATPase/permease subunit